MTDLSPLASKLHEKIWPFVSGTTKERCETIAQENEMMNREVPTLAPLIVQTPVQILANIWGIHPADAEKWRQEIEAAIS